MKQSHLVAGVLFIIILQLAYCQYYYMSPTFKNHLKQNFTCLCTLHIDNPFESHRAEELIKLIKDYKDLNDGKTPEYFFHGDRDIQHYKNTLRKCNSTTMRPDDVPLYQFKDIDHLLKMADTMGILPIKNAMKLLGTTNKMEGICSHLKDSQEIYTGPQGSMNEATYTIAIWACDMLRSINDTESATGEFLREWVTKRRLTSPEEYEKQHQDELREGDAFYRHNFQQLNRSMIMYAWNQARVWHKDIYDKKKKHEEEIEKLKKEGKYKHPLVYSANEWEKIKKTVTSKHRGVLKFYNSAYKIFTGHRASNEHLNLYESLYHTVHHYYKTSHYAQNNLLITSLGFLKRMYYSQEHTDKLLSVWDELYYLYKHNPFQGYVSYTLNVLKAHHKDYQTYITKTDGYKNGNYGYLKVTNHVFKSLNQYNYRHSIHRQLDTLNYLYYKRRLKRYRHTLKHHRYINWDDHYYDNDDRFNHLMYDKHHQQFDQYVEHWVGFHDPDPTLVIFSTDSIVLLAYGFSWLFRLPLFNQSNCNPGFPFLPDPADGCSFPTYIVGLPSSVYPAGLDPDNPQCEQYANFAVWARGVSYAIGTPLFGELVQQHPGWDPFPFGWLVLNVTGGQGLSALPPNLLICLGFNIFYGQLIFSLLMLAVYFIFVAAQIINKCLEVKERLDNETATKNEEDLPKIINFLTDLAKRDRNEYEIKLNVVDKKNQ